MYGKAQKCGSKRSSKRDMHKLLVQTTTKYNIMHIYFWYDFHLTKVVLGITIIITVRVFVTRFSYFYATRIIHRKGMIYTLGHTFR